MISTWFETQFPLSVTFKAYDTCVSLAQKVTIQSQVQMFKSVSYFDGVQLKFGYTQLTDDRDWKGWENNNKNNNNRATGNYM